MAKKKKKRAKSAKKRKRTMLPPSGDAGASTQQPLAALAAQAVALNPVAALPEVVANAAAAVPADMTPTLPPSDAVGNDIFERETLPETEVGVEHRATPRTSLVVELHLASDSHFFSGLSGDISEGGVFVSTYRDLATGTPVDLEFSLPGSDRVVHAKGEVRWHRSASPDVPPGVGIAFEELSAEDRALIHRFCTMRPPLYYDDVG
jgi:uncharacterized protein (TIGR02266 family)